MNEMRYDWLSDRWVIFAPYRSTRPDDYDRTSHIEPESQNRCPFCRGSEHETPEASLVLPLFDWESTRSTRQRERTRMQGEAFSQSRWQVRVVPNKFPALMPGLPEHHPVSQCGEPETQSNPLFVQRHTAGAHEVIIESPDHIASLTGLSLDHNRMVFQAYQQRLAYWRARSEIKYAVLFKNYGADAGATLVHSHSQLICTDFVPSEVLRVQRRLSEYRQNYQGCYVCSVLEQEIQKQERIVVASKHVVAFCPFASRFPFAVSIVPIRHRARFEECSSEELDDLAYVTRSVLQAIETEYPRCAYNFVIQTSHFDQESPDEYHWRLKIIPRLSKVAGFEWSSDCFINTVLPEAAAQALRLRIQGAAPLANPFAATPLADTAHQPR